MKTMKKLRRKLRDRSGFTLAELLIVVLILLLVSTVVATGVPAAVNSYQKVVDSANAQLLLSTTVTSLRRELSLAGSIEVEGTQVKSYTNSTRGLGQTITDETGPVEARYSLSSEENGIMRTWMDSEGKAIVPEALTRAGRNNETRMVPKYDALTYEGGIITVSQLRIEKDGTALAGPIDLKIQTLAVKEKTEP